jgi:hypothetical protein
LNKEMIWYLCPIVGILSMLGGQYNKLFRRLGVPLAISIAYILFIGWSWILIPLFLSIFIVTTLPFTLVGDGLDKSWVNYVWIWLAGYLLGLPSALLHTSGCILALITSFVMGILGTLSNWKYTEKYTPWKLCEFLIWSAMAYPYALIIGA